jgi:glycosyltransferase involved in cell wall biosynthesis
MTRPVRVLWLVKGLGRGGAEQLVLGCARNVDPRFQVEVAYVLPWKDALVPELQSTGVPVHCLDGGRAADLRWVWRLRRLLSAGEYDIVHTHMPVPAVAARLLLSSARPRIVHTEHNVWGRYRTPTRWANAATYRRNAAVIAVSGSVAESIAPDRLPRRRGADPLTVLHHGIDRDRVRTGVDDRPAVRAELGARTGEAVIGTVGNFTPKKDHRCLLEAHARLRDAGVSARLVLVGTGPLERELRLLADQLGHSDTVVFAGSRDDVPTLLTGFDVFAMSSRAEGLPLALMEAMASGLPSVVTPVGGIPEIVEDGVEGLVVPPGDPAMLAEALGLLARDPALRMRLGTAARARARSFDVAAAQRRIEEIYDRLLVPA